MTQQPKKRRKPLGNPIDYTDADLDTLADITPADILNADALWQTEAPAPYKKLLHAEKQEEKKS